MEKRNKQCKKVEEKSFRDCKTCKTKIEYIPRRVNCSSCYKKLTDWKPLTSSP